MTLKSQLGRLLVGALALVLALTLTAPPALAAPPPQPISSAVAAKVAAVPGPVLTQAKAAAPVAPSAEAPGPKPFLKTTKGALALALFAGATGYAVYSFSHDRVHSPAR